MRKGKAELSTKPLAFESAKSEWATGKETGLGRVGRRRNERLSDGRSSAGEMKRILVKETQKV